MMNEGKQRYDYEIPEKHVEAAKVLADKHDLELSYNRSTETWHTSMTEEQEIQFASELYQDVMGLPRVTIGNSTIEKEIRYNEKTPTNGDKSIAELDHLVRRSDDYADHGVDFEISDNEISTARESYLEGNANAVFELLEKHDMKSDFLPERDPNIILFDDARTLLLHDERKNENPDEVSYDDPDEKGQLKELKDALKNYKNDGDKTYIEGLKTAVDVAKGDTSKLKPTQLLDLKKAKDKPAKAVELGTSMIKAELKKSKQQKISVKR